jgi:RND family efflux transporter MFP subunit
MKLLRAVIYLLLFLGGAALLIYFLSGLLNSKLDNRSPQATSTQTTAPQEKDTSTVALPSALNNSPATEVTTIKLGTLKNSYFEATGSVKSQSSISLFPATSAAVKKVNFQEGDYVRAGDILIELSGTNLTEHPTETQQKLAEQTLKNAKDSLASLQKNNTESLKMASLQLQSSLNQAAAIAYDLAIIDQNKSALQDSLKILQDSLYNTRQKNSRDQTKGRRDIDNLIFTLNSAQDERARTQQQINDLSNQSTDPAAIEKLAKLQGALSAQDKGIEELYKAIDLAQYGLNTGENGASLGENQVLAQISQGQNQAQVLDLNLQSATTKLGYSNGSSDALLLAKQGYQSTKTQLDSALANAANQVKLAELSTALARNQAESLKIKAPFSGIITMLDLYIGQAVNPQAPVAEVIDPRSFQLEVGVDNLTADRIVPGALAQITLAGRSLDVPIRSIGLKVDEKTKLVKVTLGLPNIFFKINQNLTAKLPLSSSGSAVSQFLPLDAVTIGTESQFVYINNNGQAKKVTVQTGNIAGDQIEILSGLDPNAEVIVTGAKNLIDGQAIQVK